MQKQTQPGNGKNPGKPAQKIDTDLLSIEFTRGEGKLIYSVFTTDKLLLARPNWADGDSICKKLEKTFEGK